MKKDGEAVLFHLRSDKQLKKLASTANEVVSIIFNTILEEICSYITLEDSSSRKYVFVPHPHSHHHYSFKHQY